jgi:hypothetical protein
LREAAVKSVDQNISVNESGHDRTDPL